MDAPSSEPAVFSPDSTRRVLTTACERVGLPSVGAELVRLGQNAIYRLRGLPIVARVARSTRPLERVQQELAISRWLAGTGLPSGRAVESVDQPVLADGHAVSFWQLIEQQPPRPTVAELAAVLRRLHGLPVPKSLELPRFVIMGQVPGRVAQATCLTASERAFLLDRHDELQAAYEALEFPLGYSAIHGDAQTSNLLRSRSGELVLIDFDEFAYGPRECDIAVIATACTLFRYIHGDTYHEFASAYGFDVVAWPGFEVLRQINELKMTTWLMQNVDNSQRVAAEFRKRLADLRDPSTPRDWRGF